jgi:thymidine phosphorylase
MSDAPRAPRAASDTALHNGFRLRRVEVDTQSEHVAFVRADAVTAGRLGFKPLDRVHVSGRGPDGQRREITAVLNFCGDARLVESDEIGLSAVAFGDLGLPEGAHVRAALASAQHSVDLVRRKLRGRKLAYEDFHAILSDVALRRYSKVELSMFVLACALQKLERDEVVSLTRAMIATGRSLDFGKGPIADKHCVGGIPGNRTTMVVVPILASQGVVIPKTSSRAITSPSGTADTMGVLADVALPPERLRRVVEKVGACIAWGGALDLAPADDVLITVERPMEIDSEAQLVASILAKKKTVGASHVLIDIPVGPTAKVRTREEEDRLSGLFRAVARELGLELDVVRTDALAPIGFGIGPRLEALDVLAVLGRKPEAPRDLREKSLYLAARLLEMVGTCPHGAGYRTAQRALDEGHAERTFARIVAAQGERALEPEARHRDVVVAREDGRIRAIDCWHIARVAKQAGAPAHAAAGVRLLRGVGDVVSSGEPLFEIHAQSRAQLALAREYALARPRLFEFGF